MTGSLLSLFLAAAAVQPAQPAATPHLKWEKSFEEALKKARKAPQYSKR